MASKRVTVQNPFLQEAIHVLDGTVTPSFALAPPALTSRLRSRVGCFSSSTEL